MATYARPGVYVQETLNPIQPVAGASSNTVAALIGATDRGPTTPTLVTSWSQYVNLFGSWNSNASNALPLGVYLYFANGGNQAYILRVPGASSTVATRSFNDTAGTPQPTLQLKSANKGSWGNNLNVTISASTVTGYFNITVYLGGSTAGYIVEQWTDVTMNATDSRYAVTVINNNSTYLTATDLASTSTSPTNNPALVANQSLSTGSDGSAVTGSTIVSTAFGSPSPFDTILQSLVINIPGYTDATTVNAAISASV